VEVSAEVRELMEGGCGLIVGLVTAEGRPFATRGSGFDLSADGRHGRLVMDAHVIAPLALPRHVDLDLPVAITGAEIQTLASVQVKGTLRRIEDPTPADHARSDRYTDEFIAAVAISDGLDPKLMERWRPADVVVALVDIDELFDQTPGPVAGRRLSGAASPGPRAAR
jgi:hypothetical protein